MNEAAYNTNPNGVLPFTDEYIASLGEGTDWQEEAYNKNAPMQNHYLGFSGGNDVSTFSTSLSYDNEEGIFDYENKSQYERFGIRVNSEHKMNKHITVGENITYTHRNSRALGTGNQYNNFIRSLLEASPLLPVYDPNSYDGFARSQNNPIIGTEVPSDQQVNPIAAMHYEYNDKNKYDDIIGDIYLNAEIIKGLNFRTDMGATYNLFFQTTARDSFHLTPYTTNRTNPFFRQKMERLFGYNWDNVLSYSKNFGEHSVLAMVGTNVQDNWYFNVEGTGEGYLSNEAPVLTNISTMVRDSVIGDFGKNDSRFSVFGRVSYNYKEKYLATVSIRRDGSSRFGKNYRYGIFPAASVGWVVSEESFTEVLTWLDFLKLRASWGQNGKEPFERYRYLATVSSTNRYYFFDGAYVGISPDIFPNPDLKWEAQEQINIGFDSRFLKDFSFSADWYRKTAKDWIIPVSVPGITGIAGIDELTDPYVNAGNVTNTGIELDLAFNKQIGDFFIGLRANIAYNKNQVTEVPGEIINGSTSVLYNGSEEFYRIQEGYPVGFFWGYQTDGIFQTQEEIDSYIYYGEEDTLLIYPYARPGDVKRVDLNGDGVIDSDDKTMIGDPNPDFVYGFTINTSYKGFDFSMNLQGQAGNQIVQCYRQMERSYPNYTTEILDRWTGEGTSNRIPRVTLGNESNQNWRFFSDLYVHDAGFLRVKSINVGYDFKSSLLKNAPIGQFRIYFSALNILTFTKYNGIDPEVGYGSYYNSEGVLTDGFASGIDMGFYPTAITYLVGVNVKF